MSPKPVKLFFAHLMNPQKEGTSRSSKSSRGKILKKKVSQEPQEERLARSSRGKIIKRKVSQEPQEERFSRSSSEKILKRILKRSFIVLRHAPFVHTSKFAKK